MNNDDSKLVDKSKKKPKVAKKLPELEVKKK